MLARAICGVLALLISSCESFGVGDAFYTAAVFGEASDIKRCQETYREFGDRLAYESCVDD